MRAGLYFHLFNKNVLSDFHYEGLYSFPSPIDQIGTVLRIPVPVDYRNANDDPRLLACVRIQINSCPLLFAP